MLRKYYPGVIFLGFLLLLVFSSTSRAKTIDWLLWPLRFGIFASSSILLVWSRRRHPDDESAEGPGAQKDLADHFLMSVRRWTTANRKDRQGWPVYDRSNGLSSGLSTPR